MKTPKFRAYDHATKRMVHSEDENNEIAFVFTRGGWEVHQRPILPDINVVGEIEYLKAFIARESNEVTKEGKGNLMLFSGRQDVNEKDIYEGDIVCLVYDKSKWKIMLDNDKGFYLSYLSDFKNEVKEIPLIEECNAYEGINYVEIIGNIYQKQQ